MPNTIRRAFERSPLTGYEIHCDSMPTSRTCKLKCRKALAPCATWHCLIYSVERSLEIYALSCTYSHFCKKNTNTKSTSCFYCATHRDKVRGFIKYTIGIQCEYGLRYAVSNSISARARVMLDFFNSITNSVFATL